MYTNLHIYLFLGRLFPAHFVKIIFGYTYLNVENKQLKCARVSNESFLIIHTIIIIIILLNSIIYALIYDLIPTSIKA